MGDVNSKRLSIIQGIRQRLGRHSNHVREEGPQAPDPVLDLSTVQPPEGPPPGHHDAEEFLHDGRTYTERQLWYLVSEIKDYQLCHGSLLKGVRYETESSVPGRPIGASILPTPFPRARFEEAIELQEAYSELYMHVSNDPEWLYKVLSSLKNHDRLFTVLWDVYEKVKEAGPAQKVVSNLFRNDYMIHQPEGQAKSELKQVEINAFTCAGAAHAERVANMHKHVEKVRECRTEDSPDHPTRLAASKNVERIVDMLEQAHNIYSTTTPSTRPKCILMTVQPYNFNIADERPIELALWNRNIPCYRCEWRAMSSRTTLAEDKTLIFHPPFGGPDLEVSVIYYRGGYVIGEYEALGMQLRINLEISRAIKCPDILTHLSGFKTVQQALTKPGVVERFLPPEKAEKVRRTFMPMQILDTSPAGLKARETATDLKECLHYVLKPNRDGGGHNVYRADIPKFLASKPKEEWVQYILMRLIEPPPTTGTLMMPEDLYHGPVISELGMLATCIWERKEGGLEVKRNDVAGWTFKTKPADVDEMAVVKGYGCFDCPLLIDEATGVST